MSKSITKVQCVVAPTVNPRIEATATKVITTLKASAHSAAPARSIVLTDDGQTFEVVDHDGREYSVPIHNVVSYQVAATSEAAPADPGATEPPPAAPLPVAKAKRGKAA